MWGNSVHMAGAHQQPPLRPGGVSISGTSSGTAFSSSSYIAQPARPALAGVLSADLARPISVRELAQSRVPAVPPSAASPAPRSSATTASFAGFGIPTSPVIYAATSGVSTSQPLAVRADASDLTSLAYRDIDHLSGIDLYNYASHLQDASKQYSGYLLEAYTKRDQYRSEVAHLKEQLQSRYMQMDVLRRERERTSEALLSVREENAQLRKKLAEVEGHARNLQAKMSVLSGDDPSVAIHFYQSQVTLKDAQLRELQQRCDRAAALSLQRCSCSTTAAARGRRSTNLSSEGAAAPRDLPSEREAQDGTDAASAALHTTLEELQCLNTSLRRRLEEEHTSHEAALAAHAEASAAAAADRAHLLETIAQLRQQCTEMQTAEDELVAALTQRAPVSKKDYEALQASYDDLTAALAKAEAHVKALQEKEQQHYQSTQNAQEELRRSLATGLQERQTLQARNEQVETLASHLQRELELAERANQLRQEQLDTALSGNQQLAEHLRASQEQLLSATAELQSLRESQGDLESWPREPPQQMEEVVQADQRWRHHDGPANTMTTLDDMSAASAQREVTAVERQALESDIAALRSQRDTLAGDRDNIMSEVHRLQEERLALLRSPPPPAETELRKHSSSVRVTADAHADNAAPQQHHEFASLEAAHQRIEQMTQSIAALTSERDRLEAQLKAEVTSLEVKLASQSTALAEAEAAAAARQAHFEEIVKALKNELEATQQQENRLRVSEEALRQRCADQQSSVEQFRAHVVELEEGARATAGSLATLPSVQHHPVNTESSVVNSALEPLASQLDDAQRRIEELWAEHARTVEELARANRAVAELEVRAADAESKRESSRTSAESASAELTARIAALTMENAQLKERLSASRAAVATFASKQMDSEGAATSLEERCAAEARRREAAEAEVSALRAALADANAAAAKNAELPAALDAALDAAASERVECAALRQAHERTASELKEVLQRSEEVQATLERTVTRLAEQEGLVEVLSTENVRMQDELTAAQESVLLLRNERDALGEESVQLREKLAAAECRASDAAAAQQRLQVRLGEAEAATRSKEAELGTALAALDRTASEVCDAEQKLQAHVEAQEQLAAEHARTVEELARANRAVAELEVRAADAESKRESSRTSAESASAELTARIAALTMENAQLKERLSASRAAVATFASKQMDSEGAATSLEERCAAEARRREAAEAEVSALRAALADANAAAAKNAELPAALDAALDAAASERVECAALRQAHERTASELKEVLQRSEEVQATLERTVTRLAEQEGLVEVLSTENVRMQDELTAAQESVLLLRNERDALGEESVQLREKLAAAECRASDAAAAQQRLQVRLGEAEAATRSKEAELGTALAALDRTASEVCDAEQKLQAHVEAQEQLAAEHARTVEELARANRAVAELEVRAADAESKRESSRTSAESASAELTARIAALTMENAQLKERLSASRAAVATFASKQMDSEGAATSLEERCAAEARRREAAEAEVSALRAALADANAAAAKNAELPAALDAALDAAASERVECAALRQAHERTASELKEVLQRSEEVQATLERTVTRLAEQEGLVEVLDRNAAELNDMRAAVEREVMQLQSLLEAANTEKADAVAQLVATQRELDRAAELQDEQYREEEHLRDALATTTSAFAAQTRQVRLGMAHVVDASRAFCEAAETVAQRSSSSVSSGPIVIGEAAAQSSAISRPPAPMGDASLSTKSLREILAPWSRALEWVAAMEQRLDVLDAGAVPSAPDSAGGQRERRRRGGVTAADEEDEASVEAGSSAPALSASFLCRAVPTSHAEATFARLMNEGDAAATIIAELRSALADREAEVSSLRSAMDALATELTGEQDRADNLSAAIAEATEKVASAQAEFEEQLRQRTAATTAEVVEARRAEARAAAAQLRAEERLATVEEDLKEQQALLRHLQHENCRLTREADRLLHASRHLEPSSRDCSKVSGSVTPQPLSLPAVEAESASRRFTMSASTLEAVEQAQILQVSSLQADLMLSRRHARELAGQEATLRQACAALEQQISELRLEVADAEQLREDLATLRADYAELEQRHDQLERMTSAASGGTMQELKQLRQQLRMREAELGELKAQLRDLFVSKAAPELEATRRQEALRESLSGITMHLAATQAQYGGNVGGSSNARSRRASLTTARSDADPLTQSAPSPSSQDLLNSRIEHLQLLVHDREAALDRAQVAQLEFRAVMDTLEDQLAAKTAALERAEVLVAEYADTINTLTMNAVAGRGSRGVRSTASGPLPTGGRSPHAEAPSPSVPPLTPLTPQTCAAVNGQPHAVAVAASPAPRMPSLDEVTDDNGSHDAGKDADSARSSTATAPPSVAQRRTGACSGRRSAEGSTSHLSSSTLTKRSVSSSPSQGSGRKSLRGATVSATTRKRARSSATT
ncbi:hypothetical protein LSCM1_03532 [Leishmania martiniquensis]|uniref:NUP-1 protein n=1 Tax=Leishmania martiniquensis TaxID=1580590 RepID=A0A836KIF8_9TRYP|nr:hypothetical protein LSCM1_03532 [Leishmania martiniquensis]